MTRCWSRRSVGHGWVRAPCSGVGWIEAAVEARGGGTRSARVIESSAPATASRTRTHRTLTVQRGRAIADVRVLGVVAGADHRRDRAFEGAQDLGHRDVLGRAGELVAAVGAARADDEAGFAQADDELLEVGAREVLLGRDLGQGRRTGPVVPPELDHQADAVLALRAEGDGAAAVDRSRAVSWRRPSVVGGSGEGPSNIRVISSDMSLRGDPRPVNRARGS